MLRSRPSEELPPQMTGVPKAYSVTGGERLIVAQSHWVEPHRPENPFSPATVHRWTLSPAPSPLALDSARPPFERAASHLPGTAHRRVTSGQSPTTERVAQRYYNFRIRHGGAESGGGLQQVVEGIEKKKWKVSRPSSSLAG